MKILVASSYYSPDVCGIAPVTTDLCEELVARGHEVTVITSFPHYPEWKNKSGKRIWASSEEMLGGVRVLRYGICVPRKASNICWRLLYELSLLIGVMRFLFMGTRYDVIYAVCPSIANIVFARLRRMCFRERVVLHVQDIPADAAKAVGLTRGPLGWIASRLQTWLLKAGDSTTSISPEMSARITEVTGEPSVMTPNWLVGDLGKLIDTDEFVKNVNRPRASGPLRLLYSGNIGGKQGLDGFCAKLAASDRQFLFTINGAGAGLERLRNCAEIVGDDRFQIGELLETHEFIQKLQAADWFVITEKSGVGSAVMPSKMIPAVALGVPVLAVCDPDGSLGRAVTEFGLGLRVPWENQEMVSEAFEMPCDARLKISRACRQWSQIFTRSQNISKIEQLLQRHLTAR